MVSVSAIFNGFTVPVARCCHVSEHLLEWTMLHDVTIVTKAMQERCYERYPDLLVPTKWSEDVAAELKEIRSKTIEGDLPTLLDLRAFACDARVLCFDFKQMWFPDIGAEFARMSELDIARLVALASRNDERIGFSPLEPENLRSIIDMDPECIELCDAINALEGVETSASCCGHGQRPFEVYLKCSSPDDLSPILWAIAGTPWSLKLRPRTPNMHSFFVLEGPPGSDPEPVIASLDGFRLEHRSLRSMLTSFRLDDGRHVLASMGLESDPRWDIGPVGPPSEPVVSTDASEDQ